MVYGSRVGLHPGVILLVLPAGAAFAGIIGVFAAVPVAVFVASITASVIAALGPATDEPHPAGSRPGWIASPSGAGASSPCWSSSSPRS